MIVRSTPPVITIIHRKRSQSSKRVVVIEWQVSIDPAWAIPWTAPGNRPRSRRTSRSSSTRRSPAIYVRPSPCCYRTRMWCRPRSAWRSTTAITRIASASSSATRRSARSTCRGARAKVKCENRSIIISSFSPGMTRIGRQSATGDARLLHYQMR